jgi:hypothetical protein
MWLDGIVQRRLLIVRYVRAFRDGCDVLHARLGWHGLEMRALEFYRGNLSANLCLEDIRKKPKGAPYCNQANTASIPTVA